MLSEAEQLATWWESLTADQQAAVLAIDPDDDIPGWIVASLVAAHTAMNDDPTTETPHDFRSRVPQVLQDFVRRKQSGQ